MFIGFNYFCIYVTLSRYSTPAVLIRRTSFRSNNGIHARSVESDVILFEFPHWGNGRGRVCVGGRGRGGRLKLRRRPGMV